MVDYLSEKVELHLLGYNSGIFQEQSVTKQD